MTYAVIRLRGIQGRGHDAKKTLDTLRLHYVHHATLVPSDSSFEGMLNHIEHHIAYGEPSVETVEALLRERGRLPGDERLSDEAVDANTEHATIKKLAQALVDEDARMNDIGEIKPVFRLAPARGGFSSKKRHFNEGGSLGYRGEAIDDLIERML